MRSRWRFVTPVFVLGLVLAACTSGNNSGTSGTPAASSSGGGGGEDLSGQTVNVIGTWGGDEQTAFLSMVKPWEDADRRNGEVHRHA